MNSGKVTNETLKTIDIKLQPILYMALKVLVDCLILYRETKLYLI
jgi:hypothetical protein